MNNSNDESDEYQISFVPKRLEVKDRKDLNLFPFNVVFAGAIIKDGEQHLINSMYEPDYDSLKFNDEEKEISMLYRNIYNKGNYLCIRCKPDKNFYSGEKYINNELCGSAAGVEWNSFFFHFGMNGVQKGEEYNIGIKI